MPLACLTAYGAFFQVTSTWPCRVWRTQCGTGCCSPGGWGLHASNTTIRFMSVFARRQRLSACTSVPAELTGTLPPTVKGANMKQLYLSFNRLEGEIDDLFCTQDVDPLEVRTTHMWATVWYTPSRATGDFVCENQKNMTCWHMLQQPTTAGVSRQLMACAAYTA